MGNLIGTQQSQQQCEQGLNNVPQLKPLCSPLFKQKMDVFFNEIKTIPDLQQKYSGLEYDIESLLSLVENLNLEYNNMRVSLNDKMNNIRKNVFSITNDVNDYVDTSMTELLNDYVKTINDIERM